MFPAQLGPSDPTIFATARLNAPRIVIFAPIGTLAQLVLPVTTRTARTSALNVLIIVLNALNLPNAQYATVGITLTEDFVMSAWLMVNRLLVQTVIYAQSLTARPVALLIHALCVEMGFIC